MPEASRPLIMRTCVMVADFETDFKTCLSLHLCPQLKCPTLARTTAPCAPTSPRASWRSWRRSSTSASTWRARGAWKSPPHSSWTRRRWKYGSRTDAWSRRSARGRGPVRAHLRRPRAQIPVAASPRRRRTRTSPPCPRLQARPRAQKRSVRPCFHHPDMMQHPRARASYRFSLNIVPSGGSQMPFTS